MDENFTGNGGKIGVFFAVKWYKIVAVQKKGAAEAL